MTLVLLVALAACNHDPDDYLPTSSGTRGALNLTASTDQLPADGKAEAEVVATISPDADPDKRTIVFQTTGGKFKGVTENEGKQATIAAVANGPGTQDLAARAILVSDTTVQTVEVTAAVKDVDTLAPRAVTIDFIDPDIATIIVLSLESATAPADGVTRTRLFADVGRSGESVVFETSLGKFPNGMNKISALANAGKRATAELVSHTVPGVARVSATVGGVTVEDNLTFVSVNVVIGTSVPRAEADNASVTQIFADVAQAGTEVTFTSSMGTLLQTTATSDTNGRASVDLRSPSTPGDSRITASVTGGTSETHLPFIPALPRTLVVNVTETTLKASASESAAIEVLMLRDAGSVTDGTVVEYAALDPATGQPLGFIFRNKVPSNAGKATASVVAGNTAFRGLAIVRATVTGTDLQGQSVSVVGEEGIQIVDP